MFESMNLEVILKSFKLVKEESKLVFMGRGQKRLKLMQLAKSLHLENKVYFSEWMDRQEVPAYLSKTSIGIIYLSDTLWDRCKCPVKMYEYMAMELPIITTDVGEAAYTVRKAQCGIVVPPGDSKALTEAMNYLLENPRIRYKMGKRGREFLVKEQNYRKLGRRLRDYIEFVRSKNNFRS
jgi:glycosyltransferase involved in cell wall biosynthesis